MFDFLLLKFVEIPYIPSKCSSVLFLVELIYCCGWSFIILGGGGLVGENLSQREPSYHIQSVDMTDACFYTDFQPSAKSALNGSYCYVQANKEDLDQEIEVYGPCCFPNQSSSKDSDRDPATAVKYFQHPYGGIRTYYIECVDEAKHKTADDFVPKRAQQMLHEAAADDDDKSPLEVRLRFFLHSCILTNCIVQLAKEEEGHWNDRFQLVLERPTFTQEETHQRSSDLHKLIQA